MCLGLYTIEPLSDSKSKWNVWSASLSYEKQPVFSMCYYFCWSWIWKTLITPIASGVLSCSAVITQQGAHLRQPCLLSEPRDQAQCLGEHRKASPMMLGPPLRSLGNNKQVTWCTLHPQSLLSAIVFLFLSYSLVWLEAGANSVMSRVVMWKCHNQTRSFSHVSSNSRSALSSMSWNKSVTLLLIKTFSKLG